LSWLPFSFVLPPLIALSPSRARHPKPAKKRDNLTFQRQSQTQQKNNIFSNWIVLKDNLKTSFKTQTT
jgi:hypothetical protein